MSDESANERRERLKARLWEDEAYRNQYGTSTLIQKISAQVQAVRRQRGLSQEQLAAKIGTKQPRISAVETPPEGDRTNWEVDTLNRIAQALGTRLNITLETYGTLLDDLDTITADSLRRPDVANDPALAPKLSMPAPDPAAPERTRWMQELMIPWLWGDKLDVERLIGWLQGVGLPAVGAGEEPYKWLLRGVSVSGPAQDMLEKRLAERLAVVLGEEPDIEPIVRGSQDDFLINLYWTCAGLRQWGHLGEQLWQTYRRVKYTKPRGAVRDALQGALVNNQYGEIKPLKEIWEPMIERGRHRWLRGSEIVGYEGILVRHQTVKPDLEKVFWALGRISHRWEAGTAEEQAEFKRLMWKVPDLDQYGVARKLVESADDPEHGWKAWARHLLPAVSHRTADGSLEISVSFHGTEFYAAWPAGGFAKTSIRDRGSVAERDEERSGLSGQPKTIFLLNELLTSVGNSTDLDPRVQNVVHALVLQKALKLQSLHPAKTEGQRTEEFVADEPSETARVGIEVALIAASLVKAVEQAA
jgi:transcriptional regulator with XRE-family HTH domain